MACIGPKKESPTSYATFSLTNLRPLFIIYETMKQIYELHADVCKTLANPKRLEIINTLGAKELSFGDILDVLKIKKANLSQHLGLMRAKGIVKTRRDGVSIYYRIVNPKVIKACNIMREVLLEQLSESNKLIGKIK